MKFIRKIYNYVMYGKWTDCKHKETEAQGWYDYVCKNCGAKL